MPRCARRPCPFACKNFLHYTRATAQAIRCVVRVQQLELSDDVAARVVGRRVHARDFGGFFARILRRERREAADDRIGVRRGGLERQELLRGARAERDIEIRVF